MSGASDPKERLDTLIADYLMRLDRGESVDRERFKRSNRSLAGELDLFFRDLDVISQQVTALGHSDPEATADITAEVDGLEIPRSFIRLNARQWAARSSGKLFSFGDYDLLHELGRGGMGIVFKARQRSLDRIVCVKMMLMAELAEANEFKRFRAEAMAIARLNHPGIVAIHEVGQCNGTPYYAMEYVDGSPLSVHVTEKPLSPSAAAEYVLQIAEAIHVAHQSGIVHRDLKPSNVLLDERQRTHITDFGLAKHLEADEDLTVTGQVLGTPSYMSPEQASARRGEIGRAVDIYALGAILYALLTGRPPHRAEGALETVRRVIADTPVFPRVLNQRIPADLETICMKCLEKAPSARYPTAAALAEDLRRFLAGEPIRARRVGVVARTTRWIGRHPAVTLSVASLTLLIVASAVGLTLYNHQLGQINARLEATVDSLDDALVRAQQNELVARNLQYVSDMQLVEPYALEGDYRGSMDLLRRNVPPADKLDLRGFEWFILQQRQGNTGHTLASLPYPLYSVCLSPDGKMLALAGGSGDLLLYDMERSTLVATVHTPHPEINGLVFSARGDRLVSAGDDGYLRMWDVESRQPLLAIAAHQSQAYNVAFLDHDAVLLSCGRDPVLRLWDAQSGEDLGTMDSHGETIESLAVTRDERSVWTATAALCGLQFDLSTRQQIGSPIRSVKRPTCVAVSPDGLLAVLGELGDQLTACHSQTGKTQSIPTSHPVQSVAISPDARLLAAGDRNGNVGIWSIRPSQDAGCGYLFEAVMGWNAHDGRVYGLVFSHAADYLVSVGSDGKSYQWDLRRTVTRDRTIRWPAGNSESANSFQFLPGSALLVSANPAVGVEFWDCAKPSDRPCRTWSWTGAQCIGCSPEGDRVAAGTAQGAVAVWDTVSERMIQQWEVNESVSQIAFSSRRDLVAVVTWQRDSAFRQTQLYRLHDKQPLFTAPQRNWRHVAFSPDASQLYVALDEADHVIVWDVDQQRVVQTLNEHDTTIGRLAMSPDGRFVVTSSNDRAVLVHDTRTQETHSIRSGLQGEVSALLMGPCGTSVVIADSLGVIRVCNLQSAKRVVDLARIFESDEPRGLAMSSDGRYVAARYAGEFLVYDFLPDGVPADWISSRPPW